eukprot:gnl/MRDRNA2_/MRDRNA2_91076_c0_seq1.p1 gnl/MRDRNA2_/MRDRNA2_91076_c0~~gnl/MRDRNA2_/MRDRNA2_91076_c0_seq1.p1  ORF type:complete len:357 (+),score=89.00 gnl/MRDRNA2_/MRDRNA2_91076_c0_seq1:33-1073(+)
MEGVGFATALGNIREMDARKRLISQQAPLGQPHAGPGDLLHFGNGISPEYSSICNCIKDEFAVVSKLFQHEIANMAAISQAEGISLKEELWKLQTSFSEMRQEIHELRLAQIWDLAPMLQTIDKLQETMSDGKLLAKPSSDLDLQPILERIDTLVLESERNHIPAKQEIVPIIVEEIQKIKQSEYMDYLQLRPLLHDIWTQTNRTSVDFSQILDEIMALDHRIQKELKGPATLPEGIVKLEQEPKETLPNVPGTEDVHTELKLIVDKIDAMQATFDSKIQDVRKQANKRLDVDFALVLDEIRKRGKSSTNDDSAKLQESCQKLQDVVQKLDAMWRVDDCLSPVTEI